MRRAEAAQPRVHPCPMRRPDPMETPRAVVLGCAGERLSAEESAFFRRRRPARLRAVPAQLPRPGSAARAGRRIARLRSGGDDAPVLIDQEGGRVARLRPPQWRAYPAAARDRRIARPARRRSGAARRAADRRRSRRARHHRRLRAGARPAGARRRPGDRRPRLGQRAGARGPARPRVLRGAPGRRRAAGRQAHPRPRPRAGRQPSRLPARRRQPRRSCRTAILRRSARCRRCRGR